MCNQWFLTVRFFSRFLIFKFWELKLTITLICVGSIVAIQDVHEHMYFAVDSEENKYSLGGTIHYSLVGERALFRV